MPIAIFMENNVLKIKNPEDYEALRKSHYGEKQKGEIVLTPEEAMYLIEVRNAVCTENGRNVSFSELASRFSRDKLFAEYMTFRDWRERGLVIKPYKKDGKYEKNPTVKYPSRETKFPKIHTEAIFFKDDMMAVLEDEKIGKELYYNYWIGQYGSYKAEGRGKFLKLDKFETYFLVKNCGLNIANMAKKEFESFLNEDKDFESMYNVYEDWRMNGFVVKTGFKFGTHFRIYFPGALPGKGKDWTHSKHVLHVFPRNKRMLIAEWARAIRVAHGVRKTFILAIPGKKTKSEKGLISFFLYHRKNNNIETPDKDTPSFALVSLSEEEMIGGNELAGAIEEAKGLGLDVMLGIVDRETSVTYYRVKRIELPNSKYEYYEIEWIQP
ncbi:MAG: tRNA-intron lyase [Candidatus Micrarchaeota archaeon]|nr:tRNA-intron lyase [Candidatus Micrarchaeota archaeon]